VGEGAPVCVTIEVTDMRIVEQIRALLPEGVQVRVEPGREAAPTSPLTVEPSRNILHDLTARQREVLDLLVLGLSNKAIGRKLSLSHFTVRNHISQIMRLLDVSTRKEVIARLEHLAFDTQRSMD